jgi:hypothetical protein
MAELIENRAGFPLIVFFSEKSFGSDHLENGKMVSKTTHAFPMKCLGVRLRG